MYRTYMYIRMHYTLRSPMVFYDEDTKMFFVAVKGESTIMFYELTDKSPCLSPGEGRTLECVHSRSLGLRT